MSVSEREEEIIELLLTCLPPESDAAVASSFTMTFRSPVRASSLVLIMRKASSPLSELVRALKKSGFVKFVVRLEP